MSSEDAIEIAPPREAAPHVDGDQDEMWKVARLCSGEAGKEHELNVLCVLLESHHKEYFVLPAGALKNELVSALVFSDAPMSKSDMSQVEVELKGMISSSAKVFARGDVVGVDVVMIPLCAVAEGNATAARSMIKLVEIKSSEKVSASTVCGSLALQLWMQRRDVHRTWWLCGSSPGGVAPLLTTHPRFMLGEAASDGLFNTVVVPLSDDVKGVQAAFKGSALPAKDLVESVRAMLCTMPDAIKAECAARPESYAHRVEVQKAASRLLFTLKNHEACVKVAQERQAECRERRSAKKRHIDELYHGLYSGIL